MKQIQKKLEMIANSIRAIAHKVEDIRKQIESEQKSGAGSKAEPVKASTVKKAARIKPAKPDETDTAYALFLKAVEDSGDGAVSAADLKAKTGFNDKKIANLVYKAKKQGKIKSAGRGMYTKG